VDLECVIVLQDKSEDTKGVIRRRTSKDRQCKCQHKKGQTTIYKTLHRKLKIEQHEHHLKSGVNSGAAEGYAVSPPHVAPVALLFLQTRWNVMN